MKKVIVTGATGFIGRHLIEALSKDGIDVIAVGRRWRGHDRIKCFPTNIRAIEFNATDLCHLPDRIEDNDVDTFIHLAWGGVNGEDKEDYRIQLSNCLTACEAVEAAVKMGCKRFVFVGSVDEYEFDSLPDEPFKASSHSKIYGISKYAAETIGKIIAKESGIEYVASLLALTYGEGNATNVLPNMIIRNSLVNNPIKLISGENYFDLIYIQEAIDGIKAVAEKGHDRESYYIGHAEIKNFKDTVKEICKILESDIELLFGQYRDIDTPLDYSKIDREKLFRDTGYACNISLEIGIRNTALWICDTEKV